MVDLSSLDTNKASEEGVWCDIENPANGELTGIRIKVLGMDSKVYIDHVRRIQDKNLKKGFRGIKSMKTETLDNNKIETICVCTVDWENVEYNGQQLSCDAENKRWLYKTFRWIFDQVDEFIGDRAHFLGESGSK
jgi:HD superfamily phosphohydrolase